MIWCESSKRFATRANVDFGLSPITRSPRTAEAYLSGAISENRTPLVAALATAAVPTALWQRLRAPRGSALLQRPGEGLTDKRELNSPVHEAKPHGRSRVCRESRAG